MSTFGAAPFGTARFGGPGEIVIRGAVAISRREVLIDFDKEPLSIDSAGFESATNPKNWAFVAIDPTVGSAPPPSPVPTYEPAIIAVDAGAFPTQVILATDTPMEDGVYYEATAQPAIRGANCEALVDQVAWQVLARRNGPGLMIRSYYLDRYRDVRLDGDGATVTEAGDLALAGGIDSLRQRLYRRITTALGGFVMLTGYGTAIRLKQLLRAGDAQALANAITSQVSQEPDVEQGSADVSIVQALGVQVVEVTITVAQREGRDRVFAFEFPSEAPA